MKSSQPQQLINPKHLFDGIDQITEERWVTEVQRETTDLWCQRGTGPRPELLGGNPLWSQEPIMEMALDGWSEGGITTMSSFCCNIFDLICICFFPLLQMWHVNSIESGLEKVHSYL